jgi:DNA-binding NtrC family response regulator
MSNRHLLYLRPEISENVFPDDLSFPGWQVHRASDVERAQNVLADYEIDVGLAAVDSSKNDQLFTFLKKESQTANQMEWIALLPDSVHETPEVSRLIKDNFYDYHTTPPDYERLHTVIGHAWGMAKIARRLRTNLNETAPGEEEMVGTSPAMQEVFHSIRKIAGVEAPVLITGESGTGKELAAKAIHERSSRAGGPFVAVNCAALPSSLIQSELFGHEKGSFTGAHQRKIGRIESAKGGTVFLDEIGDIPLDIQVNLLRFLQEKTIERVGGGASIEVDVRVIAATNVKLEQVVSESKFREDLYYRLNVLNLEMPPLRERASDIELLARFFFERFSGEKNKQLNGFSDASFQVMRSYTWPGNVRELINRIRRAMVMGESRLISPNDLGLDRRKTKRHLKTLDQARSEAEKQIILSVLNNTKNNISEAARILDVSRVTLYRLMEKHEIVSP